jgi:uncharacterized protein (TIGR03437 family)
MYGSIRRLASIGALLTISAVRGTAGEADALAISANIQARHFRFGTVIDPIFAAADSDEIVGYTRCGDSALWTGSYLAAEAFRYRVTRAPEALENVRKAIAGIKSLADVTGTNLLARCIIETDSPFATGIRSEEADHGAYVNGPWTWIGNTSRDQYSGAMFGLAVAYDMVDDTDVRNSVSQLVTRLVDFLRGHNWAVVMPDGKISTVFIGRGDQQLSFLQVARHVNPDRFSTAYDISRVLLSAEMLAPIGVDVTVDDSYFKFNLDYINLYDLIRLESSSAKSIYEKAYDILRNHTVGHQNAFFNLIDRGLKSPDAARDAETLTLLEAWLQRPRRDKIVDLHAVVPVCGGQACRPVPVPMRPPTDFLWQRNPFQLAGGLYGTIEGAGIDYILPYWMARYYAVGSAFNVQSAAATSSAVAPDSIASIFGSNLSAATDKASAQPLPTSLGNVGVTVRDSAGAERRAPLIYVSPGQINLIIPKETATGVATFMVVNGSATLTAVGMVRDVAPTLFSMNGNGIGVAAATAIRARASDPQAQSPVAVFQCNATDCVPTPIELAPDAPVYLNLYGTGIRNRSSLAAVTVTIRDIAVPVLYAGAQPDFAGLDQVNVPLPLELRGAGETNVLLAVDGQTANAVTINIK